MTRVQRDEYADAIHRWYLLLRQAHCRDVWEALAAWSSRLHVAAGLAAADARWERRSRLA